MSKRRREFPEWPVGKPLPAFTDCNGAYERLKDYSMADVMDAGSEELVFEALARRHVFTVRMDEKELAALRAVARATNRPAADVVRELVRRAASELAAHHPGDAGSAGEEEPCGQDASADASDPDAFKAGIEKAEATGEGSASYRPKDSGSRSGRTDRHKNR